MVNTISEPTFYHTGGSSSIDVILTNQKGRLITSGTINTHLSDGHMLIYTVMRLSAPKQLPRTIVYRSFKTFREKDFIDDLSAAPLHVADTFNDPEGCYWMFNCMLTDILNTHAPLKQKKKRSKHTSFMNSRLKKAVMNKHRLWRRYKKYPSWKTWEQYRLQRNIVTSIRKTSIRSYFKKRTERGPKNSDFWPTVKPFLTNKGAMGTQDLMIEHDNKIITDPKNVADIMNSFYVNIAGHIGQDFTVTEYTNVTDVTL